MFVAVWIVVVITASGLVPFELKENAPFPDEAACQAHIAAHAARVPDFARGQLNIAFSVPVHAQGACKPQDKAPAPSAIERPARY